MSIAAGGSDNQAVAMVTVGTACKRIALVTVIGPNGAHFEPENCLTMCYCVQKHGCKTPQTTQTLKTLMDWPIGNCNQLRI